MSDHVCYVDCEPTERGGHVMYPAEPSSDAGRYQAALNISMTRREFRASGQDESRECRMLTLLHRIAPRRGGRATSRRRQEALFPDSREYSD